MREELRRRIPKTRGWATGIIIGILAIVGVVAYLIYRAAVLDTPKHMVTRVIVAARAGDQTAVKAALTPDSLSDPAAEGWLKQLTTVLARPGVEVSDVATVGDDSTVKIAVPRQSATGTLEPLEVGVRTKRGEGGWKIDLPGTMSVNSQLWIQMAGEK